jgi:hypothetical protein
MSWSTDAFRLAGAMAAMSLPAMLDSAVARNNLRPVAPQNHDGVYAVQIVTERGGCDKSYLWTIAISDGRVSSTGSTPLEASGQINPQGIVSLAFRGFNEVAHVVGRLKGSRGSGTWSSPTMACAGTWRALRQS